MNEGDIRVESLRIILDLSVWIGIIIEVVKLVRNCRVRGGDFSVRGVKDRWYEGGNVNDKLGIVKWYVE